MKWAGLALFFTVLQDRDSDRLKKELDRYIDAVNVEPTVPVRPVGESFLNLPVEMLPHLKRAQSRNDLRWTACVCIAKAIRKLEPKAKKEAMTKEQQAAASEVYFFYFQEYKRVSKRALEWDGPALEGLNTMTEVWGSSGFSTKEDARRAAELLKKALDSGCDDPLVHYASTRLQMDLGLADPAELARTHDEAVRKIGESAYHPMLRFWAYKNAARYLMDAKSDLPKAARYLDRAGPLFLEGISEKKLTPTRILQGAVDLIDLYARLGKRKEGFDAIHKGMLQTLKDSPIPWIVEGKFNVNYAWDARGGDTADKVTEEGWRLFHERLGKARESLLKAWNLSPGNYEAAFPMLTVCRGDGSEREEMDLWFMRAMEANPDSHPACGKMLYYLEPKWHGSREEMLRFARDCVLTGNWEGGLPMVLVDAHLSIARYGPKGWQVYSDPEYFKDGTAWTEMEPVFRKYLDVHPEAIHNRCLMAKTAAYSGHWGDAHEQFEKIGEYPPHLRAFQTKEEYDALRAEARKNAQGR